MYRLVVVEDERDVRRRLVSHITKAEPKFDLVAEYENGVDAYDGILNDNPDLVITDIRIPYIDGIELSKMIRETLPLVKIIIITGYSEFNYAKEAANLGVIGFISKPVTQEDIDALLKKASEELDNEFLTSSNLTQLEAFYTDSLPIIREYDLYRLSTMSYVTPAFKRKLHHNNIILDYKYFAMCVFDFDESTGGDVERHELGFSSVRKQVQEDFSGSLDIDMFNRSERLCLILKSNEPVEIPKIESMMETIIARVGRFSGMPVSAGMSSVYENSMNFAQMYNEALRALEYRGAIGGQKVFFVGDSAPVPAGKLLIDDSDIHKLMYMLRFKSLEECEAHISGLRQALEDETAKNSYYYAITHILNTLLRTCNDLEGLYAQYSGQHVIYRRLFESKTADAAFSYLTELAQNIRQLNDNIIVGSMESNLQKILSYMDTHYEDANLSLESLAFEVSLSVSYISALLKKNMNTSFIKHLTSLRMEKAKELLNNPEMKIIDIAEHLGYMDPYYFSHCFKKYTGVSPKEFRKNE